MKFIARFSLLRPSMTVHSERCRIVTLRWRDTRATQRTVEARSASEAAAMVRQELTENGQGDIPVHVCRCAKEAREQ